MYMSFWPVTPFAEKAKVRAWRLARVCAPLHSRKRTNPNPPKRHIHITLAVINWIIMKIYLILLISLLLISCSSKESRVRSSLSEIDIVLSDEIKILEYHEGGITDYLQDSRFSVSEQDRQKIISIFEKIEKEELPNRQSDFFNQKSTYRTDSSYILIIRYPTKNAFTEHRIEICNDYVKYNYWIE